MEWESKFFGHFSSYVLKHISGGSLSEITWKVQTLWRHIFEEIIDFCNDKKLILLKIDGWEKITLKLKPEKLQISNQDLKVLSPKIFSLW